MVESNPEAIAVHLIRAGTHLERALAAIPGDGRSPPDLAAMRTTCEVALRDARQALALARQAGASLASRWATAASSCAIRRSLGSGV